MRFESCRSGCRYEVRNDTHDRRLLPVIWKQLLSAPSASETIQCYSECVRMSCGQHVSQRKASDWFLDRSGHARNSGHMVRTRDPGDLQMRVQLGCVRPCTVRGILQPPTAPDGGHTNPHSCELDTLGGKSASCEPHLPSCSPSVNSSTPPLRKNSCPIQLFVYVTPFSVALCM